MSATERVVLLAVADAPLRHQLVAELLRTCRPGQLPLVASLDQARLRASRLLPSVILLDESATGESSLEASARELTPFAAVVVLASSAHQAEMAALVAGGAVDFVAAVGSFLPMAAACVERRLNAAEQTEPFSANTRFPEDLAEIIRHEVNNPLTGILGNAELLLARRDRLPAAAVQRLETIADLAVRLRETIRRLSSEPAPQSQASSM